MINQHALSRTQGRKDFVIAGYSFGSLVAIELARKLEAEGLTGRLVLIDGSPEFARTVVKHKFKSNTHEELQNNILLAIMDILAPTGNPRVSIYNFLNCLITEFLKCIPFYIQFVTDLQKCTKWEDKLEFFISHIPANAKLSISIENQRTFITSIYIRSRAILDYDPSDLPPISSSIILLKATSRMMPYPSEDYGLEKVYINTFIL